MQPKLQKWIQEAAENDPEQMGQYNLLVSLARQLMMKLLPTDKLLLINDLINQVLDRYTAFLKGDREAVAEINPAYVLPRAVPVLR